MKKVVFVLVLLALVLGLFPSCSTDFEVYAPEKEIRAVYCILNPTDSIQYVRVSRVFQFEGDAIAYAGANDLSLSGLNVKLTNVSDPAKNWQATEVPNFPKDPDGIFVSSQNIYQFTTDGNDTLVPWERYRLEVGTADTDEYITGVTTIPGRPRIRGELNLTAGAGNSRCLPRLNLDKRFNLFWERLDRNTDPKINYEIRVNWEYAANGVVKNVNWGPTDIFNSNKRCSEGSASVCYQFAAKELLGYFSTWMPEDIFVDYTYVTKDSCVPDASLISTMPKSLGFEVTAVDEYLSNYITVNNPKFTDLSGTKPEYTNLTGNMEAIGVVGSINTDIRYAIMRSCSEALLGLNGTDTPAGCSWD